MPTRPPEVKLVYRRRLSDATSKNSSNGGSYATGAMTEIEGDQLIVAPLSKDGTASDTTKDHGDVNFIEAVRSSEGVAEKDGPGIEQLRLPFDTAPVKPSDAWGSTNIDIQDNEEAAVPDPFVAYDSEDDDREVKAQKHRSAPLPDFYTLDKVPEDLTTLQPLEYYPMDLDVDPIRLLVVLPHFGNPFSTVECNLFPVSLKQNHYCYAAVRNTRGNKHLTSHIVINNCVKTVTRNLEVFLRHFRQEQYAMVVWINEICVDTCDFEVHRSPEWKEMIIEKACKRMDMDPFMHMLQSKGILEKEKQFTVRLKDWMNVARATKLPTYYPIPWRKFTEEQIKGKESDLPVVPHRYLPLDMVAEEIRLVVLLPSQDPTAPLVAHLAHESLHGPAAYQCLSYTWGDGPADQDLVLNGQLIKIRKSLADALKAIRSREPGNMVTIWADAICINQDDMAERSRQVSRMHQVYEAADAVLIWLGNDDEDSDIAMDFVIELRDPFGTVFDESTRNDQPKLLETEDVARKWLALYRLLLRPYFRRLWIVQELTLASVPTAFCGEKYVPWHDIHQASLVLQFHRPQIRGLCDKLGMPLVDEMQPQMVHRGCPNCFQPRLPDLDLTLPHKLTWHREMRKHNRLPSFLYLCLLNRDAECGNPRDKIYALWNLAAEANALADFQPDYSLSTQDVYFNFTKAYIRATDSLDIICVPANYCSQGAEPLDLPSWVTDWRFRSAVNCYIRSNGVPMSDFEELATIDKPLYRAAGDTKAVVGFHSDDETVLGCAGIVLDTIAYVSSERVDPEKWFQEAKQYCHRDGEALDYQTLDRQFTSMTMGDATCSWESDETRTRCRYIGSSENKFHNVQVMPGKVVQSPIKARAFIVTEKGYMGLAPYWVETGMGLAILLGCSVPVLLQKRKMAYQVRGDCFVQGWMMGEMLEPFGVEVEDVVRNVVEMFPPIALR